MSSPSSSSNLLNSPAFAQTARAEAATAASLLRANKPSAESSDRFAQLMKTYASSASAPAAPQVAPAPSPAPAAVARPPEGKTELQRQEQKLAQKHQTEASKPRPPATHQGAKTAGSVAAKNAADAAKAAGATADAAVTAADSSTQTEPGTGKKARAAGDAGDTGNANGDSGNAAADQAVDRSNASTPATQTGLLGLAQASLTAEQGIDSTPTAADGTAANERTAASAQLGASQARTASQHSLQIDDTAALQAQQATASDAGAEADFGQQLQTLLGSAAKGLDINAAAAAPKIEGLSAEGLAAMLAAPTVLEARSEIAGSRQITLSQPLTEPGFAPEMAARLSVLAADGVQEARLHLNPAEMGPVTVQIIVDGQQAQISFHAEHEQTRAVLEQSLPDLAAALRDSGLTLSGGGVFQQPGDQGHAAQSEAGNAPAAGGRADARLSVSAEAAPTPIRQSRGVVDLYA